MQVELAKCGSGAGFLPTEDADSGKKELLVARNVLEIGAKVWDTFEYNHFKFVASVQGDSSALRPGLGRLCFGCSTKLPRYTATSAKFLAALIELGRQWNN